MEAIKNQFIKNLNSLKEEIDSYENEKDIWLLKGSIKNSPANLALHVCGNLKHNFGAVIGENGFKRNRDAEFSTKGLTKKDIINEIEETLKMITPVLDKLCSEDLMKPYPDTSMGEGETIGSVLIRIGAHLGYHLGQINYHRRLL